MRNTQPKSDLPEPKSSSPETAAKRRAGRPRRSGGEEAVSSVQVLERAVRVLGCFESGEYVMSLAALARAADLPKTTAFRILSTLETEGVVSREAGGYRLGHRVLRWGSLYRTGNDLRARAVPVLRHLRDVTGETTHLFVREGPHRVCIEKMDSLHPVRQFVEVGAVMPLHAGSAGKVFLAFMGASERAAVLKAARSPNGSDLAAYTPSTCTAPGRLEAELAEIRQRGWASSFEERTAGASSASVPVFGFTGELVATVGISGPIYRITPERIETWLPELIKAGQVLSRQMGYGDQVQKGE